MTPIVMPQIGQDIEAGTIVEWRKRENDPVNKGEVMLVVESEKATFDVEAEESGVLLKILHGAGEEVAILTPIGYIGQPGERFDPQQVGPAPPAQPRRERPPASPAARRIAQQRGVDLRGLRGTGPGGRITQGDVLAAAPAGLAAAAGQDTVVPFDKMRRRIAERLAASKRTIPHFYLLADVDMTEAQGWRRRFNAERDAHLTVTDLIVKAAAMALRAFPRLNAHVDEDKLIVRKNVNVGVAVAVKDGLLVPVIPDADRKGLLEISRLSKDHAEAARRGVIRAGPLGTFTITSLGMYGVRQYVPIINPPECAILAVGSIQPRAVPLGGRIAARDVMTLTLACDHRAVDGTEAAGLLDRIRQGLEQLSQDPRPWLRSAGGDER